MKKILLATTLLTFTFSLPAQKYFQFRFQDKPRSYIVYTPKNFNPAENLPLVINMHGFSTDAAFHMDYTQYNKTADTARCIVVYPNGWEKRWSTGTTFGITTDIDDVGFLSEMMDRLIVLYNVNPRKIFSTGYSAGGFMSYKLGCDLTNRIAGIAPNASSMTFDNYSSCVPARVMPLIAANGTGDAIVPLAGIPDNFPRIDSIVRFWQQFNGCDASPVTDTLPNTVTSDGSRVVRLTFTNCTNAITTTYYRILNGGHTWPGAEDAFVGVLGKTNQDISWNNTGWQFLRNLEVPAPLVCNAPANLLATAITADSFQLSWDAIPGVDTFKVALIDTANTVTFYNVGGTSLNIRTDAGNTYRWNVGSNCASGFRNWTATRALTGVATAVRNNTAQRLAIFPNPAANHIQTGLENLNGSYIRIINTLGQEQPVSLDISGNRISTDELAPGSYFLTVITGNTSYSGSFVKL